MVFHRAFWGGIRLYLCDETHNYQLRPKGCDILPFGYTATVRRTWDPAFGCELSLFTAGDSVYIQLRTDDALREGLRFEAGVLQGVSVRTVRLGRSPVQASRSPRMGGLGFRGRAAGDLVHRTGDDDRGLPSGAIWALPITPWRRTEKSS